MPSDGPAPRPALPAAASALVAGLVAGPLAPATVVAAHRFALYLSVRGRVLPLVTSDAVALPTAVRLAATSGDVRWGVGAGDVVTVGAGRVVLPGLDVVAARSWRPSRVRHHSSRVGCPRGRPGSHVSTQLGWDPTGAEIGWLADGIRAAVSTPRRDAVPGDACAGGGRGDHTHRGQDAVDVLVGRGPGLTPSGDDALAGALLVAHALRAAPHLAPAVRARLGATTAVSAALLDAAADGFAARPVVALVDAVVAGDAESASRALPAVLAIGHTSGHDTVTGIRAALDALTSETTNDERSAA